MNTHTYKYEHKYIYLYIKYTLYIIMGKHLEFQKGFTPKEYSQILL